MNAFVERRKTHAQGALKERIVQFARDTSTEISPHDEGIVDELANVLPRGTTVYVAHTPKASIHDVVRVASAVQRSGLRASPHIVARRIESEGVLRGALKELTAAGVEQVLLVAGDRDPPAGEFTSTLDASIEQIFEASVKKTAVG